MTPIAKNVIVVDEFGNEHTPTYAKRAQGLVKKGRARWLDEHTICLACPPDNMEDIDMENHAIDNGAEARREYNDNPVTVADILARLDRIIEQSGGLADVIRQIHDLPVNEGPEGGMDGYSRAEAISSICVAREVTRQKEIDLLTQIYQDMLSPSSPCIERERRLAARADIIGMARQAALDLGADSSDVLAFYERQLDKI